MDLSLQGLKGIEKEDLKRYGIVTVGLLMSIGFAFGAIASFSSIIETPEPGQQQGEQVMPPEQNFKEGSFELGQRAQFQLSYINDIAFVNAYYTNQEEKQSMKNDLETIPSEFNERVFVQLVNESNKDNIAFSFANRIDEYPAYIVVGGNQDESNKISSGGLKDRQEVIRDVCTVMRDWSGLGQCQAL